MKPETLPAAAPLPYGRGIDLLEADRSFPALLGLYLPQDLRDHLMLHFRRLGQLAGGDLDALARVADLNLGL